MKSIYSSCIQRVSRLTRFSVYTKLTLILLKGDKGPTFSVDLKFVPLLAFHTDFILFQHFKAIRFSPTPKGLASTRTAHRPEVSIVNSFCSVWISV